MLRQNADLTRTPLTMPNHPRINGATLRTICRQSGISREDFSSGPTRRLEAIPIAHRQRKIETGGVNQLNQCVWKDAAGPRRRAQNPQAGSSHGRHRTDQHD